MRYLLITLLLSVIFDISFGQKSYKKPRQDPEDPRVYDITKNGPSALNPEYTKIRYTSYDEILNELYQKKDAELWSVDKFDSEMKLLPVGGKLTLLVNRSAMEEANTTSFSVLLRDEDGNELFQKRLDHGIAQFSSGAEGWWNIAVISIPVEIQSGTRVFVIDHSNNKRFRYFLSL